MTALRDPDAADEPAAKRQATLPMLSQVESLTSARVATAKDECPSTPVDPNISQFLEGTLSAAPAQYAAEERMRSLGLVAFCDALAFAGLREELLRYSAAGVTILAPTDDAFAQVPEEVRTDVRLVRSLLLGHLCTGTYTLEGLKDKECAVAIAGQTHAVYEEDGHTCVGTACFGRTDLAFEGGLVQELTSVMMVLWLVRDSHTEQVWKKSLQPSPVVSTVGGNSNTGNEPPHERPIPLCANIAAPASRHAQPGAAARPAPPLAGAHVLRRHRPRQPIPGRPHGPRERRSHAHAPLTFRSCKCRPAAPPAFRVAQLGAAARPALPLPRTPPAHTFCAPVGHVSHLQVVLGPLERRSHALPHPAVSLAGNEYEVHGCLLHAATGSLIPDGLRGHARSIKPLEGEQRLAFTEITVLTKPPSLAKRRGVDAEIGNNRYRLLFSVWNMATQSYVTWQHMATPLVVRNSFHMLPIEEKVL